jgi:hypothetical protein
VRAIARDETPPPAMFLGTVFTEQIGKEPPSATAPRLQSKDDYV